MFGQRHPHVLSPACPAWEHGKSQLGNLMRAGSLPGSTGSRSAAPGSCAMPARLCQRNRHKQGCGCYPAPNVPQSGHPALRAAAWEPWVGFPALAPVCCVAAGQSRNLCFCPSPAQLKEIGFGSGLPIQTAHLTAPLMQHWLAFDMPAVPITIKWMRFNNTQEALSCGARISRCLLLPMHRKALWDKELK